VIRLARDWKLARLLVSFYVSGEVDDKLQRIGRSAGTRLVEQ